MFCCNKKFSPLDSFFITDDRYIFKKIEFGYCPHCGKAIYIENKKDFNNKHLCNLKARHEAESAYQKALLNRLIFISKVKQGSRSKQYWCFGDCKESIRKENGKIVQFQIKRNMNGEEVENLGLSEVILR